MDSLVPLFPSPGYEGIQHGEFGVTQAVSPQRGESNDLGVWTWLSSRSLMTPDLEPFHILLPAVSQLLS